MTNAFDRVTYEGHTLDRLTLAAFEHGADLLSATPPMVQGCYNPVSSGKGVPASGGTHDLSGAFDIEPPAGFTHDDVVRAYRWAGVAIWHRTPDQGPWEEHDHGIVVGDTHASQAALNQVHDYHAGLNGLATHLADTTWRPNPILAFRYPLRIVSLQRVHDQATAAAAKRQPIVGVRHVQRCLNMKRQAGLSVDGIFGTKTRVAYKRWELQVGGDGDGIPGSFALKLLGASQFRVTA